jgi:hypothetical protein
MCTLAKITYDFTAPQIHIFFHKDGTKKFKEKHPIIGLLFNWLKHIVYYF